MPQTIIAALLTFGAGHSAVAAAPHGSGGGGFRGGARAGFGGGARAGFGAPTRGFAGRGYGGRYGRFGPGYGWRGRGPGWGWGWGFGLGWYVPVLPLYYSTFWWGGVPYYYANDYYYEWNPSVGQYEAVVPPPGVTQQAGAQASEAAGAAELFAYPKNGQSSAQQAADKQQCRAWARSQLGITSSGNAAANGGDSAEAAAGSENTAVGALQQAAQASPGPPPTAAGSLNTAGTAPKDAGAASANEEQHSAYLRAETACLEGRGYSVQ